MIQRFCAIAFVVVCLVSCGGKQETISDEIVAKAFGKTLTRGDIANIIELSKSVPDSIAFVEEYLKQWAADEVLYRQAEEYYKNDEQINRQVEEYRQTLVLDKYKRVLMEQESGQPTEEEIEIFYNKNRSHFLLSMPIVKGAAMSIAFNSPNIKKLREAMKKLDPKSIDEIERLSLKQPFSYTFFLNDWVTVADVAYIIPKQIIEQSGGLSPNTLYEYRDNALLYMVKIVDYMPPKSETPLEMASDDVAFLLKEEKNKTFIEAYIDDIVNKEQKRGNIIINYSPKK